MIQELIKDQPFFSDDGDVFRTPPSTPKLNGSSKSSPRNSQVFRVSSHHNNNSEVQRDKRQIGAGLPSTSSQESPDSNDCLKVAELMALLKANEEQEKQLLQQQLQQQTSEETTKEMPPSAPPRRRDRTKNLLARKPTESPPRVGVNGLPPTPKVLMGACFSKVFNECPLRILCSASWIHPDTRDQHVLLGCEEGLYTLNLNELHDACIDQLFPRRTTWMFVIKDILMSVSGKTTHLFRHDLVQLHATRSTSGNNTSKFTAQVDQMINKIPDRFVPWKMSATTKMPDTRGVTRCCVGRNPYNGYKYLCGVSPSGLFLMQWYNPLNKFMLLKNFECFLPHRLTIFEMIITPDKEYPMLLTGVRRSFDSDLMKLDLINLNSTANWFEEDIRDGTETVIPRRSELLNITSASQLDKDSILICFESKSILTVNEAQCGHVFLLCN